MIQFYRVICARDIAPGDVVVLRAGDTRQVHHAAPAGDGSLISVDWGDGRHSLLDAWRTLFRLHPLTPDPKSAPPVLDLEATSDSPTSPSSQEQQ